MSDVKTVIISDDGYFHPEEITIGDSEDVFDSIVLEDEFDRIVVLRNEIGSSRGVKTKFIFEKLVNVIKRMGEKKPRSLIFALTSKDVFDVSNWMSTRMYTSKTDMTIKCKHYPPSFPMDESEWQIDSLLTSKIGYSANARIPNGSSIVIFRYSHKDLYEIIRKQLLTHTDSDSIFSVSKRVFGEVMSHNITREMQYLLQVLPDSNAVTTCTVYCDKYATMTNLLPPKSIKSVLLGSVRVDGISVPIEWDLETDQQMELISIGPKTHVWAFDTDRNLKSFNNAKDTDMMVKFPFRRIFFFPNMRSWILIDMRHLFIEGLHENIDLPLLESTSVLLGNSVASIRSQNDSTNMVWNCNTKFNAVPTRMVGSRIKSVEVMSVM